MKPGDLNPVVLLGGSGSCLSVARTLSRLGTEVTVLGSGSSPVAKSRACSHYVNVGSGAEMQPRSLEWLLNNATPAVVLPCGDDGIELIAKHRDELVEVGYRPIEARDDLLLAMLNKERTYELSRQAGIECPRTVTIRTDADLDWARETLSFPWALKPLHSHLSARHTTPKVFLVHGASEARKQLSYVRSLEIEVLATEIIPGWDDQYMSYYTYIDKSGNPLFHFTKRTLRGYPIHFGLCVYQVSQWFPEVADLGLRFCKRVGLRGVVNIEFKRDARDGRLKLIECNHRFTAGNELVLRAGIDVARIAYMSALGKPTATISSFRQGLYMWHPPEDIAGFLAYKSIGEISTARWLRSLVHRQYFPLFRWTDPYPSLLTWSQLPSRLWRYRANKTAKAMPPVEAGASG
jgi:D-aspartate ligase